MSPLQQLFENLHGPEGERRMQEAQKFQMRVVDAIVKEAKEHEARKVAK